jgi:D-glycero-alpha-D-manno-heptose-7-phosphate kinase
VHLRWLPNHFEHLSKIVYSKVELVNNNNDIQHPVVNALINNEGLHKGDYSNTGFEMYHFADLPAFRGLGSSSAFAVGLLNAWGNLYYSHNDDKEQLAIEAISLEQEDLKENVGCQDQWLCALGGVNYLRFRAGDISGSNPYIEKLHHWPNDNTITNLASYIMLVDTKTKRIASGIASAQIDEMPKHEDDMLRMVAMAREGKYLLEKNDLTGFAKLLHESWQVKKLLSPKITFPEAEYIYGIARKHGALGGKVIGAGGGGYFMLLAEPDTHKLIKEALEGYKCIDNIAFDYKGATVIYKDAG